MITFVRENTIIKGVKCRFIAADLFNDLHDLEGKGTFDFALDRELLHHIFPEDRDMYPNKFGNA